MKITRLMNTTGLAVPLFVAGMTIAMGQVTARAQCEVVDDFEDGVIDKGQWLVGGACRALGCGGYTWIHEEIMAKDGYLQVRIEGPSTGNSHGAEAWVRTTYDYNDGSDHVVDFTWGAAVDPGEHVDGYGIHITNGYIAPPEVTSIDWWITDPSLSHLYCTMKGAKEPECCDGKGQQDLQPTNWSIVIDATDHTATLFEGPDGIGTIRCVAALDPDEPWHLRFFHMDVSSSGFPGTDNSLFLYSFLSCSVEQPGCPADLDGDGEVRVPDLILLLSSWGSCVTNLVLNGEFTKNADGWELIPHNAANWQESPGCDGNPGWFQINDNAGEVPETWQLITGLISGETYVVSGCYKRLHENWPDPNFRVLIEKEILFEAGGSVEDGWTNFSFEYVANNTEVLLRFQAQVTGDDDYGIDNIRIVRK